MQYTKRLMQWSFGSVLTFAAVFLCAVCQAADPAPAMSAPAMAATNGIIRIKAGQTNSLTDAEGNVWLSDRGFADGETTDRPSIEIKKTKTPALFQSERYSMTSFSYPVPNGKYTVNLYFAETYEGITGAGQRVFSFNVNGQEFKEFDVWVKAGGPFTAYVESVKTEVTNGKLDIKFTSNIENPEINAIEIIPAS